MWRRRTPRAARRARLVILLAKRGRAVHHAAAGVLSDEVSREYAEGALGPLLLLEVVEGRRVLLALERLAGERLAQHLELLEALLVLFRVLLGGQLRVELAEPGRWNAAESATSSRPQGRTATFPMGPERLSGSAQARQRSQARESVQPQAAKVESCGAAMSCGHSPPGGRRAVALP